MSFLLGISGSCRTYRHYRWQTSTYLSVKRTGQSSPQRYTLSVKVGGLVMPCHKKKLSFFFHLHGFIIYIQICLSVRRAWKQSLWKCCCLEECNLVKHFYIELVSQSILFPLIWGKVLWQQLEKCVPHVSHFPAPTGVKYTVESLQRVLDLQHGLIPVGAWKTSKGKDPRGILIRCCNHLSTPPPTQQRLETLSGRPSFSAYYLCITTLHKPPSLGGPLNSSFFSLGWG